jgi:transcriptional regulator with XRE-family HTH domain
MKEEEEEKEKLTAKSNYTVVLEKVIAIRIDLEITQISVAEHIRIGESGYFKLETGKTKLDLERLFEILELLKVTPEEFFKGIK